jgi:hypothetical protein
VGGVGRGVSVAVHGTGKGALGYERMDVVLGWLPSGNIQFTLMPIYAEANLRRGATIKRNKLYDRFSRNPDKNPAV